MELRGASRFFLANATRGDCRIGIYAGTFTLSTCRVGPNAGVGGICGGDVGLLCYAVARFLDVLRRGKRITHDAWAAAKRKLGNERFQDTLLLGFGKLAAGDVDQ